MLTEIGVERKHGPVMCEIRLLLNHRPVLGSEQEVVRTREERSVAPLGLACCRSQGRVTARTLKGGGQE
jgi:hypothetical protein